MDLKFYNFTGAWQKCYHQMSEILQFYIGVAKVLSLDVRNFTILQGRGQSVITRCQKVYNFTVVWQKCYHQMSESLQFYSGRGKSVITRCQKFYNFTVGVAKVLSLDVRKFTILQERGQSVITKCHKVYNFTGAWQKCYH